MRNKPIIILFIVYLFFGCSQKPEKDRAMPQKVQGKYRISLGNQSLEIDPSIGGRIISLKINNVNFLTGRDINKINWGSTFWVSPQLKWQGPIIRAMDSKAYTATIIDKKVIMVSKKTPKVGLVIKKILSANKIKKFYSLRYVIINKAGSVIKIAPWEVTRVKIGGLFFFPMGKGEITGGLKPFTTKKNGIIWFRYRKEEINSIRDPHSGNTRYRQLYADGKGWLAEVNNGVVLVKKFPNVLLKKIAPNEGEVELFVSKIRKNKAYVEMENQGAYEQLAPGDSLMWEVKWYIRKLPDSIKVETGNSSLVEYVRKLIE